MPSPFPGMNPYLEHEDPWHDFHERFIPAAAEVLGSLIGRQYIVHIDEHVYIHELPEDNWRLLGRSDVSIGTLSPASESLSSAAVAAPTRVHLPAVDVEGQSYIEIQDRHDRQLITVIELLSPSNKDAGADRAQYLSKRREMLRSFAHFVEIDLLRGFSRMPSTGLPPCSYCVLVSRVETRPHADAWPIQLRDPLPIVPIPLRQPDKDALLDLQQLLHRIYDAARYEDYIYRHSPKPPLTPEDAAWAQQFVPVHA